MEMVRRLEQIYVYTAYWENQILNAVEYEHNIVGQDQIVKVKSKQVE